MCKNLRLNCTNIFFDDIMYEVIKGIIVSVNIF